MELLENEEICDLGLKNLKIIQNNKWFKFGIDSVLLSDFAKNIKKNSIVCDLGTGTGILPILLCGKTELKKIYGIEIQEDVANMAKRSVLLNNLEEKVDIINSNILDLKKNNLIEPNSIDVIISNPPYKELGTGIINEEEKKNISRHEITASLDDFIKVSKNLLKDKGTLYMVHRPDRLVDIISTLRSYNIEPKEIRFVYPKEGEESNLLLIKAVKGGLKSIKILKPLYVYKRDSNNEYTDEIYEIYNMKRD